MAPRKLNLTPAQQAEVLGYFSNPRVKTLLEVQVHPKGIVEFKQFYAKHQGKPFVRPPKGFSILNPNSDKWGHQFRVYFDLLKNPPHLPPVMFRETVSGPSYRKRIGNKELGELMLRNGFDIGDNSGAGVHKLVRSKIDPSYIQQFDAGYNLI